MWLDLTLAVLLCCAAWFDLCSHRIPNGLVAAGMVSGLLLNSLLPAGLGLSTALQGMGLGLLLLLPLYLLRAMGAGDVKLMAMIGSFIGPMAIVAVTLFTFVCGGVMALAVALQTGQSGRVFGNIYMVLQGAALQVIGGQKPDISVPRPAGKLPYAVAIAAGTMFYMLFWRNL